MNLKELTVDRTSTPASIKVVIEDETGDMSTHRFVGDIVSGVTFHSSGYLAVNVTVQPATPKKDNLPNTLFTG